MWFNMFGRRLLRLPIRLVGVGLTVMALDRACQFLRGAGLDAWVPWLIIVVLALCGLRLLR